MPSCAAIGCNNRSNEGGITFHKFPKNEDLRKKWTIAVKRDNWVPGKFSTICSAHFRKEDLDMTSLCRVRLREDAVPCIFPAILGKDLKERRPIKRKLDIAFNSTTTSVTDPSPEVTESPRKVLRKALKTTKIKLLKSKKKIKTLQQKNRRLLKKVANLENILKELREKLNMSEEDCSMLQSISKTSECLLKRSIRKSKSTRYNQVFEDRLRSFSITLHFLSPKAYNFIRKTFNTALPNPRTLRRWYSSVDAEPGFSMEVVRALKEYSARTEGPVLASLMIDSMAIRKHLEWDGKKFHGSINVGSYIDGDAVTMATEALVFHLVFLQRSWKIPVGYFFVAGTTGDQLCGLIKQCITLMHDSGITVTSLTCDGASCNLASLNMLGCSLKPENLVTWFPNPVTNEPVFFFLDPCHMLKLVRNTLGDLGTVKDKNNNLIEWRCVEELHNVQNLEGLHLGNRLTNSHIKYKKQKMKVKLAAQVFSQSVADALRFLMENQHPAFQECAPTVEFIEIFNQLFDILNSRSLKAKYSKKALSPSNIELSKEFMLKAKSYIFGLKNNNGSPILKSIRKTGFLGFLICIESTLAMYDKYVVNGCLSYFPVYKISQDHIERLFGYIRARGGNNNNPTCKQFTGSFKRILLHKELEESGQGNCLVLDKSVLFKLNTNKAPEEEINASLREWRVLEEDERQQVLSDDQEMDDFVATVASADVLSTLSCNIVEYIAGYIVRTLEPKIMCKQCVNLLTCNIDTGTRSLISCKNKGGLIQPSKSVTQICEICEVVFRRVFKVDGTCDNSAMTKMTQEVLGLCVGKNIFGDSNSDHVFDGESELSHFVLLIKAVSQKFFNLRLRYYTKKFNEKLHFSKVRAHLTKTITFMGQ